MGILFCSDLLRTVIIYISVSCFCIFLRTVLVDPKSHTDTRRGPLSGFFRTAQHWWLPYTYLPTYLPTYLWYLPTSVDVDHKHLMTCRRIDGWMDGWMDE